jgi:hypothetical protein
MGLLLTQEYCQISQNKKNTILQIPSPQTKRDILPFLGLTGVFGIWIHNYLITANYYMRLLEGTQIILYLALLIPFNLLKQTSSSTPAVSIPNTNKITHLYLHSDKGQALGLVAQSSGDSIVPIAFLSKQLDAIYSNWTTCPIALAPAALLIPEAFNFQFTYDSLVISQH